MGLQRLEYCCRGCEAFVESFVCYGRILNCIQKDHGMRLSLILMTCSLCLGLTACTINGRTTIKQSRYSPEEEIVAERTACEMHKFFGSKVANTPVFALTDPLHEPGNAFLCLVMPPCILLIAADIIATPYFITEFFFFRDCNINEHIRTKEYFPSLASISQSKGIVGSRVTLVGKKLERNPIVVFGTEKAILEKVSAEEIIAIIPSVKEEEVGVFVKTSKGETKPIKFRVIPAKPPLLTINDVALSVNSGASVLSAGESGKIKFSISNVKGAGKAFGLRLIPIVKNQQNLDLNYPESVDIGDLDSGESRQVALPLNAGLSLGTWELAFSMKMTEANDFAPDPFEVKIRTKKLEPPDLQLAKIEVDDKFYPDRTEKLSVGNGNSIVEPGESVEVSATLLNKGAGLTKDTKVKVVSESSDITFLSPMEFTSGDIRPGQWQDLKIAFSVKKGYRGGEDLPIKLVLTEDRERFNKELPLNIKLKRSYPKTELVDIKGQETPQKPVVMPSFGDELLNIPTAKSENNDAVAVVIGVQNYKNKDVPSVEYALNDAQLFKDYLQTALGYREGNIIYLENPTKADLEKVFGTSDNHAGQLSDYVKKDKSDVFIYYTGHGAPDLQTKQAYLVPADADPSYIKLGGYPLEILYDNLSRLTARRVSVVLDACFSGQSDKGMIIRKASPLMIAPILSGSENIDIFSSSKADEISSWYPEKRHSLFTYFFLKGLQGAADKNKDRAITAAELDEYVAENVPYYARRLYGRKQTPAFTGKEDKVVARY